MGRNITIAVKCSKEEEKRIIDKAERVGMKKSTFLRYLGLNSNISITLEE